MEAALEAGAEDFLAEEEGYTVYTEPTQLHAVKTALEATGLVALSAELEWVPKSTVRVEGEQAQQLVKLIDALEDLDDVQKVEGNYDIDDAAYGDDA
jgi:transcriptional/translational regulatory protein YebC/TACO1